MNEWMNKWMNKWMNEWINEWINEWMKEGRKEGRTSRAIMSHYGFWWQIIFCTVGPPLKDI